MSRYLQCVLMGITLIGLSMGMLCVSQPIFEDQPGGDTQAKVSEARLNAARALDSTGAVLIDILQQSAPGHEPHDPFGVNGGTMWQSRLGGPVVLPLAALTTPPLGEYDLLRFGVSGNTARVLSIRVPTTSLGDQEGTVVEFNFRAINPFAYGHNPANPAYTLAEGKFPSNDPDIPSRSIIDPGLGSVAVLVRGLPFTNTAAVHTTAVMPTSDTAWLGFMRDNALNSGLFYLLQAARSGGPVALADILGSEGDYQSVQINGSDFEPVCDWSTTYVNGLPIFPGMKPYAFADLSNLDAMGNVVGGLGGFVFVFRYGLTAPVVVDPAQPIAASGNLAMPPLSGYDEIALSAFTGDTTYHTPIRKLDGPPGVHELSLAVYFWHSGDEPE